MIVPIQELIDAAVKDAAEDEFRRHLGASIIGRDCEREIYYSHRWASPPSFEGRVLRLFNRGHEEEPRFIKWMRMIGIEFEDIDPDTVPSLWYHAESDSYVVAMPGEHQHHNMQLDDVTDIKWHVMRAKEMFNVELPHGQQFYFKGCRGHFGGSLDGKAWNVPFVERFGLSRDTKILVEFKTHGEKSFTKLLADKTVLVSKPEHHVQMVQYMEQKALPLALYCAVNKNTDALYFEFVLPNPGLALSSIAKADRIIFSERIPDRMFGASPYAFKCKFCDHRAACHFGAPLVKSCRTCVFSQPIDDGRWRCNKWNATIPKDKERAGCNAFKQITD